MFRWNSADAGFIPMDDKDPADKTGKSYLKIEQIIEARLARGGTFFRSSGGLSNDTRI
jgi:hypothetical protein